MNITDMDLLSFSMSDTQTYAIQVSGKNPADKLELEGVIDILFLCHPEPYLVFDSLLDDSDTPLANNKIMIQDRLPKTSKI